MGLLALESKSGGALALSLARGSTQEETAKVRLSVCASPGCSVGKEGRQELPSKVQLLYVVLRTEQFV